MHGVRSVICMLLLVIESKELEKFHDYIEKRALEKNNHFCHIKNMLNTIKIERELMYK